MGSSGSATNQSNPKILTRFNYEPWSTWLRDELVAEGLWSVVGGTEIIGLDHEEWKEKNSKALLKIREFSGRFFKFINMTDSAKDAWNYLRWSHHKRNVPVIAYKSYEQYLPLQRAIVKGDWKRARPYLDQNAGIVRTRITPKGDTPLIFAVQQGHLQIVKELVKRMDLKDLEMKNDLGHTALSAAAFEGTALSAKVMLEKNRDLVRKQNITGTIPLVTAALFNNKDMVRYLYQITPKEDLEQRNHFNGSILIVALISGDMYDVASTVVQWCGELAITPNFFHETAIEALAQRPTAFLSGSRMTFMARCIYKCIITKSETGGRNPSRKKRDEENPPDNSVDEMGYRGQGTFQALLNGLSSRLLSLTGVDQIYMKKLMHIQAHILLKQLHDQVMTFDYLPRQESHVRSSIFKAAESGTVEFILEIVNSCPLLVWIRDDNDQTIFHVAVKHRQEKIFNLIYKLGNEKVNMACQIDGEGNNILHLAGQLAPPERLHRVSGAALQLQRELQWFKEVATITPPLIRNSKNKKNERPQALFNEKHRDLVKEGEKWMKDTATSCTVVATLIATVMFAAAFQVPGGNDDKGLPNFLHSKYFMLFAIADMLSLFSSITAALMFLYILTSRYAQEDFLISLPEKLIIGLLLLFLSMVTMMVSFGAAIFIMLHQKVVWIIVPISLLAGVPITLFVLLQFPLFVDMINSSYGPGIFIKDTKPFCT